MGKYFATTFTKLYFKFRNLFLIIEISYQKEYMYSMSRKIR